MPSFDVVSKFDMQELDNAVNMVVRDMVNRYDLEEAKLKSVLIKVKNKL